MFLQAKSRQLLHFLKSSLLSHLSLNFTLPVLLQPQWVHKNSVAQFETTLQHSGVCVCVCMNSPPHKKQNSTWLCCGRTRNIKNASAFPSCAHTPIPKYRIPTYGVIHKIIQCHMISSYFSAILHLSASFVATINQNIQFIQENEAITIVFFITFTLFKIFKLDYKSP